MINNDSIVTAYDEHLTLVEWLQKIEKLLANGGLKTTTLNDKGNATFSLTLTFNDDTTIESPDMTLTSVNEALDNLGKYKGFDNITYDETNSVRIDNEFSVEKWTLKQTNTITLSNEDALKAKTILLKAIKYGFIIYIVDASINHFYICPLSSCSISNNNIVATFGASSPNQQSGEGFTIGLDNDNSYYCEIEEI